MSFCFTPCLVLLATFCKRLRPCAAHIWCLDSSLCEEPRACALQVVDVLVDCSAVGALQILLTGVSAC